MQLFFNLPKQNSVFKRILALGTYSKLGITVMDNDYLTSLLVILLTNLLNNHCP